ncbi:SIMPL domain-containing protein [Nitritalea halalkaliphila]|nr:SIMPL domain-containing protein [Nitritalea halalkaliphila]
MKRLSFLSLSLLGFFLFTGFEVFSQYHPNDPRVEVTGVAFKELIPDRLFFDITLSEKDARTKMNALERDLQRALRDAGVDVEKQLKVKDAFGSLESRLLRKNEVQNTKTFELELRTAADLDAVLTQLSEKKITEIVLNRMEHSAINEELLELKKEAIMDAKNKADVLAATLSQRVGAAVYIVDTSMPSTVIRMRGTSSLKMMADMEELALLDIKPIRLESRLNVHFRLLAD